VTARRAAFVLLALVVGLVMIGPTAVGAQLDGDGSPSTASSSVCDDLAPDDDGIAVGETQMIGPLTVTVESAEWQPLVNDFFDEGYLAVDYEVVNDGAGIVTHRGYHNFELLDLEPTGTSPTILDSEAMTSDVPLGPGEGVTGRVTFPVGYGDGDYRLEYQADGFFDTGPKGYWAIAVDADADPEPTDTVIPIPVITIGIESVTGYDIAIEIESDGSAVFTETIDYDFSTQQRHGIFRDLIVRQACSGRYDRVYPLEVLSVESPSGAPAQHKIESLGASKRIKIGDPNRIVSGAQTYVVRYRLDGILNGFDDHDELYWNVVGDQWGVALSGITVEVTVPGGADRAACFAGVGGSRAPCTSSSVDDGVASFSQAQLYPYQGMTIAVGFPKGGVPEPTPILDEHWSFMRAFEVTPFTLSATLVLAVLLLILYAVLRRRVGGDLQAVGSASDIAFAPVGAPGAPAPFFDDEHTPVEFAPPDGIRPAQMSLLMHERARPADISATIVDLAVRGFVRIGQTPGGGDYTFELLGKNDDELLGYEQRLLAGLFSTSAEVKLSSLKRKFSHKMRSLVNALYIDAVERGWFHERPDRARTRWRVRGVLVTLAAFVALVLAVIFTKMALLTLPFIMFGLLLTFTAGAMPRRTAAGTGLLRRCKGFEQFITDSEAPRARWAEHNNVFSEYPPYAIVLGEADRWATTFEGLDAATLVPDAAWFFGTDAFSAVNLTNAMNQFTSLTASALVAVAASTGGSSGSSGFSSSSSSSSSGGSSGGGGGGGGGGSW
jgi:uncharacterized membrane protein YgcG